MLVGMSIRPGLCLHSTFPGWMNKQPDQADLCSQQPRLQYTVMVAGARHLSCLLKHFLHSVEVLDKCVL